MNAKVRKDKDLGLLKGSQPFGLHRHVGFLLLVPNFMNKEIEHAFPFNLCLKLSGILSFRVKIWWISFRQEGLQPLKQLLQTIMATQSSH